MPFATVNTVSTQRIRREANNKSAPIPAQQRQKKLEARKDKQEAIDDAVGEWYSYTIAKADDLAQRFNKKPRYFLDIFFQGGARMVNHQSKVNPYNAFKSLKAQELSDSKSSLFSHLQSSWFVRWGAHKACQPPRGTQRRV